MSRIHQFLFFSFCSFNLAAHPAEVIWEKQYGIGIPDSSIVVADVIEGGNDELVLTTTTGRVILADFAGEILWSVPTKEMFANPPTVCDLFPGEGLEVLTLSREGTIRAFTSEGEEMWTASLPSGLDWNRTTLVASDLDRNGSIEILAGDLSGEFHCFDRLGQILWKYRVEEGFSCPPAVADLDGDLSAEVLLTSASKKLIALKANGEPLWEADLGCINHSGPVVADLQGDGFGDILVGGEDGTLKCFSSGGKLEWTLKVGDKEIDSTIAVGNLVQGGNLEIVCIDLGGNLVCANAHGREIWRNTLPSRSRRPPSIADFNGDGEMEVLATGYFSNFFLYSSEGELIEQTPGFSTNGGATLIETQGRLAAVIPGANGAVQCLTWQQSPPNAPVTIEWGMYRRNASQTGSLLKTPPPKLDPSLEIADREILQASGTGLQPILRKTLADLKTDRQSLASLGASLPGLISLELRLIDLTESVGKLISGPERRGIPTLLVALRNTETRIAEAVRLSEESRLIIERLKTEGKHSFLAWPTNPWWQIRKPHEESKAYLNSERIDLEMYRNETESAAINLMNLSEETLSIQIKVESPQDSEKAPQVTCFETVSVPTEVEAFSDDALVELNQGNLIRVSPGETRQVFVNLSASGESSGQFEYQIQFTPLIPQSQSKSVSIQAKVHDLDILEGTPPYLCTWGYAHSSRLKDFPEETWKNRISHGDNVMVVTSDQFPLGVYDTEGEWTEPLHWKNLGAFIDSCPGQQMLLFLVADVVRPATGGLSIEAKKKAMKAWVKEWVEYLDSKGLGYNRFAYYPVDEPGLNPGLVDLFIDYAKQMREADPQVLIYTDPVERADFNDIQRMAPYVDIWCPNRMGFLLKDQDPRMDLMKADGGLLWTYECLDHGKHRPPLQYYRGLAWLSALRGCSGFGFWSYCTSVDDPWFYPKKGLHDYLLVYPGRGVVTSRRWEAVRDGVEDMRAVSLLRKKLAEHPNLEADSAIQQALSELGQIGLRPNGTGDHTTEGLEWITPERVDEEYAAYLSHRKRITELTLGN